MFDTSNQKNSIQTKVIYESFSLFFDFTKLLP